MAFLDEFDKKLTMLGQGAIQKTKEVTDSAKLSSAIKGLEMQKKEAFSELGKMYYEVYKQYGGSVGQDTANVISTIKEIEQEILQKQDQIRKVKGVIYCPNCNAEIPVNSTFCNVCGTKIVKQSEGPQFHSDNAAQKAFEVPSQPKTYQKEGNTCRHCGAALEEDQMFCIFCGARVEKETPAYTEEVSLNSKTDMPVNSEVHALSCPNCGVEVTEDQDFCIMCGTSLKNVKVSYNIEENVQVETDLAEPVLSEENQNIKQKETRQCPNCGNELKEGQKFCIICGTKIE